MGTKSKFKYPYKGIQHLNSLAKALSIPIQELIEISRQANDLYIAQPPIKKDSSEKRYTFGAKSRLKKILIRINNVFLKRVQYPDFIQNVKGKSYITNAQEHVNSKIIFNEDIKKFFPSTKRKWVLLVWKDFFHFSNKVAECLTNLTTKNGFLPEGAETSTYLANLIFFDIEPQLYVNFTNQGLVYTRYVDNISISSKSNIEDKKKSRIIVNIYRMMWSKDYKPKRKKHEIVGNNERQIVTGCTINGKAPTKPKKKVKNIRVAIKKLEMELDRSSNSYKVLYKKVSSRVYELLRLNPKIGNKYLIRLQKITPTIYV